MDATSEPKETGGSPAEAAGSKMKVLLKDERLETVLEALLFVSPGPVTLRRLAEACGREAADVREALARLAAELRRSGRAFVLAEIAQGYQLLTRPEFQEVIARLKRSRDAERLSPSALETLAIVAYRQPIIRAEIESVRGVQCGPVLRKLLERRMIRAAGRDDRPGHPILYRTTRRFLEHFGLKSLKDLPSVSDLRPPPAS